MLAVASEAWWVALAGGAREVSAQIEEMSRQANGDSMHERVGAKKGDVHSPSFDWT
jgi:hypothetical protein